MAQRIRVERWQIYRYRRLRGLPDAWTGAGKPPQFLVDAVNNHIVDLNEECAATQAPPTVRWCTNRARQLFVANMITYLNNADIGFGTDQTLPGPNVPLAPDFVSHALRHFRHPAPRRLEAPPPDPPLPAPQDNRRHSWDDTNQRQERSIPSSPQREDRRTRPSLDISAIISKALSDTGISQDDADGRTFQVSWTAPRDRQSQQPPEDRPRSPRDHEAVAPQNEEEEEPTEDTSAPQSRKRHRGR